MGAGTLQKVVRLAGARIERRRREDRRAKGVGSGEGCLPSPLGGLGVPLASTLGSGAEPDRQRIFSILRATER